MVDEHRLYNALSKFVVDWMVEENILGRKPFQSEIIGALEMVKADIYAIHSADRILTSRFGELLSKLEGKSIKIDDKKSITIERLKESD